LKTEYPLVYEKLGNDLEGVADDEILAHIRDIEEMEKYLATCPKCQGLDHCINKYRPGERSFLIAENRSLYRSVNFCRYERARQHEEKVKALLRSARISKRFEFNSLDNFEETPKNKTALNTAKEFVNNFDLEQGKGLMIAGPVGTGKTHLAIGVLKAIIKKGIPGIYVTVPELLDDIRQSYRENNGKSGKLLELIKTTPVLLLDDLGTEKISDWVQETLFVIINARYDNMLPTIVTTNCSPDELEQRIGERAVSRLIEMCQGVLLAGDDWRKRKLKRESKGKPAARI